MNRICLIPNPQCEELARLRRECAECELDLKLQFEATKHCLRAETITDATREHPFAAMGIAAAGGALAWELLSIGRLRGAVRLAFSSVASSVISSFAGPPDEA